VTRRVAVLLLLAGAVAATSVGPAAPVAAASAGAAAAASAGPAAAVPARAQPSSALTHGVALYRRGHLRAAEAAFRRAVALRPRDPQAYQWLAAVLYHRRRLADAHAVLRRALALAPLSPDLWLWFGYVQAQRGDVAGARHAFRQVLRRRPAGPAAELARRGLWALQPLSSPAARRPPAAARPAALDPRTYHRLARAYNPALSEVEAALIASAILGYGHHYNLDPRLIVSVIAIESGFAPRARSPKGAMGLGQLMPATAAALGVDADDPVQNVYGTVRVLRGHLDRYGWTNLHLALAAYNAGKGAVARYGGVPPYAETRWYVYNVMTLYRRLLARYPASPTEGDRRPSPEGGPGQGPRGAAAGGA